MGADAIKPLMTEYQASTDPVRRTFALYALGKIQSAQIIQAAPLALEAAQSEDLELRDTATRALGRFVESIPPSDLSEKLRVAFIESLQHNLADANAGIRAKAVRSLGKLAKCGHLDAAEREKLQATCRLMLGIDDNFDWDRAYIVRKEAEEALRYT
jgi:HEAT repeat protein